MTAREPLLSGRAGPPYHRLGPIVRAVEPSFSPLHAAPGRIDDEHDVIEPFEGRKAEVLLNLIRVMGVDGTGRQPTHREKDEGNAENHHGDPLA